MTTIYEHRTRLEAAHSLRSNLTTATNDLLGFLARYQGHFTTRLDKKGTDRARALFSTMESFLNTQLSELIQRWEAEEREALGRNIRQDIETAMKENPDP